MVERAAGVRYISGCKMRPDNESEQFMTESDKPEMDMGIEDMAEGVGSEDAQSSAAEAGAENAVPGSDDTDEAGGGTPSDLQAEFDSLNDRHLRLAAEFNNFRRRAEQESLGTWARAQTDLVRKFLDVLDDLQRVSGLDPADEATTVESIVEGIDLVERKFVRALEDAGVTVIDPAEGDAFDPEHMEAMMKVPVDDDSKDDVVAATFQKGYQLDDNLVRPARVSVYKAD